jgi:hypothetical protein
VSRLIGPRFVIVCLNVVIASLTACDSARLGPQSRPLRGNWGGSSAMLSASDSGAIVRQSCAETTISSPVVFNEDGGFVALGLREQVGGALRPREFERIDAVYVIGELLPHVTDRLRVVIRLQRDDGLRDTLLLRRGVTVQVLPCPL